MEDLPDEAKARIRASAMWLVTGMLAIGVLVLLYALVVGFDRPRPAAVDAVSVRGQDLVVRYVGGSDGCGDPGWVEVVEQSDTEVVLAAHAIVRNASRYGRSCDDVGIAMLGTVRLAEPLGERVVRDESRPDVQVPVEPLDELLADVG